MSALVGKERRPDLGSMVAQYLEIPKGVPGTLMSVLGELVQSPKSSSHGKQVFCQSFAEYLSALLIEIVHAFWQ